MRHKLAFLISRIFELPNLFLVSTFLLFQTTDKSLDQIWIWLLLTMLFLVISPITYYLYAREKGFISDLDMTRREERTGFYIVAIISSILLLTFAIIWNSPTVLKFFALAILINYLFFATVNLYWKISLHTGFVTVGCVILTLFLGKIWALTFLLVIIVGWSRYVLQKHTFWQLVGGSLASGMITYIIFKLFGY